MCQGFIILLSLWFQWQMIAPMRRGMGNMLCFQCCVPDEVDGSVDLLVCFRSLTAWITKLRGDTSGRNRCSACSWQRRSPVLEHTSCMYNNLSAMTSASITGPIAFLNTENAMIDGTTCSLPIGPRLSK